MGDGDAVIELVGVEKRFGDAIAVDGVDIAIERGEFFSLLGPSGCGKTTLLRMLAGFETPTEGRILRWWDYWDLTTLLGSAPQWWLDHIMGGYES